MQMLLFFRNALDSILFFPTIDGLDVKSEPSIILEGISLEVTSMFQRCLTHESSPVSR